MINKLLCLIFIIFLSLLNNTFANDLSYCKRDIKNKNYIYAAKSCKKACNHDNGEGCANLGVLYYNGQGIHTSKKQASYYFQKGCNLGYQKGCDYLSITGIQRDIPATIIKNKQQNKSLSPRSNNNYISDCKRHFKDKNYIDATQSCEKACNQDNGEGCTNLGVLYYNGQGIYASKKQASDYFQKGCNLGYQKGCYYLDGKVVIPQESTTSAKVGIQKNPDSTPAKQFNIFAFLIVTGPITYIIFTVVINLVRKLITKIQRDIANRNRKKEETKRNNSFNYTENDNYSSSSNKTGNKNRTHDESNNTAVFAELFALAGFVAKAQGTITQKQIQEVTKALNKLELSSQERKYYQDKFNIGKDIYFSPSESCQKLASMVDGMNSKEKKAFISFSLDLLLPVIFADGVISDEERKRLLMITRALDLSVVFINNLINEYISRYSKSQNKEKTKRNNSSDHTKNTNYSSSSNTTGSKEQTDKTQTHSESDNNFVFAELFALAGFVAKAQGTISQKQIQEVTKALNKLGLSSQERKYYQDKFNFGKSLYFAPSESCQKLASMVDGMNSEEKKAFILFSLDLLLPVIFADGVISDEERKRLLMITRALDLNDVFINNLVNEYINRYSESENGFEKALRILGLSKNSQFEEAKAKYRILMKKYHPDKVGLLHLTAEQEAKIREEYNKKSKEINEAFDIIRAHFGR